MYYSPQEPPQNIVDRADEARKEFEVVVERKQRRLYIVASIVGVVLVATAWWYGQVQLTLNDAHQSQIAAEATPTPTTKAENDPQVAGVTFGDLLAKKRDFSGWLAGVVDGSVVISNPESGEINTLYQSADEWHGPISPLVWSPDHTKLAFLQMPKQEADGFSQDPVGQVNKLGLESVPTASSFPYGFVTILDVATKQLSTSSIEVRNLPQNFVWKNESTLLVLGTSLEELTVENMEVKTIAGAGTNDENSQILPPLAWDSSTQTVYFTRVAHTQNNSVRKIIGLSYKNDEVVELSVVREGSKEEVMTSSGISLAMSPDNKRLGYISDKGVGYISLPDGGLHELPYSDELLWMRDSLLSGADWVSSDRLAFESLAVDGSRVWGAWDVESDKVATFGRGSLSASWHGASGKLAMVLSGGDEIGIVTPNWEKTDDSKIDIVSLPWELVYW